MSHLPTNKIEAAIKTEPIMIANGVSMCMAGWAPFECKVSYSSSLTLKICLHASICENLRRKTANYLCSVSAIKWE
jgi:hypothetical protein